MPAAGDLDRLITIQRSIVDVGTHGDEQAAWIDPTRRRASVRYGTGAERREAAQTGSAQSATFIIRSDGVTRLIKVTDRILFDDAAWDIRGIAAMGRVAIEITAVRQA